MEESPLVEWLYEDNHLLALNKPAGLLSQGDRTGDTNVVVLAKAYLKNKYQKPGNVYIGLVHRLDRPVSGAMILARTSKAAQRLSAAFKERRIEKKYVAIVEGRLPDAGDMADHLYKDTKGGRVHVDALKGKEARLKWQKLGEIGKGTVVGIRLITGRPHQIRCQFAHRGWPVVGDMRYGATGEFDGRSLALHCHELAFQHPVRRTSTTIRADKPPTWPRLPVVAGDW